MNAEQIYRGSPGQHISSAATEAGELATELSTSVMLEFNEIRVRVMPGQPAESIVADWQRGMDAAAEAYRASPAGQQAAQRRADDLHQAQAAHDAAMALLPATFADARSAITWLMSFYDSADDIGVVRKDFGRVADVLEASGWRDSEACGLPQAEYEKPAVLGRWIIGQAIDMLRKGLPPHPVLMDKFGQRYTSHTHPLGVASLSDGRVWSLWDVLTHDAASFYRATLAVHRMEAAIRDKKGVVENDDGSIDLVPFLEDETEKSYFHTQLLFLRMHLKHIDTPVTMAVVDEAIREIKSELAFPESVQATLADIERTLRRELKTRRFFVLQPREHFYFAPSSPHFGEEVAAKFASEAAFEIDEAAKCLALSRPTAAVFHVARLLEIAIRAIARCLAIPDPVRPAERNWGTILRLVRAEAEKRWPHQADRMSGDGQLFVELQTSLDLVKNAWRDSTMHVEKKYTDDEAEHIFIAVKGFMRKLASRMDENGEPKA